MRTLIVRILKYTVIAFFIIVPIRFFIAQPFIVAGTSMEPTFGPNEYLVIEQISHRYEKPMRGDLVIFRYPLDPSIFFIKRIVGLPGEVVHVENGSVTISSQDQLKHQVLVEPYVIPAHVVRLTSTTTLESDEYYVLGDNRDESSDSRVWGPLQARFIVGRPLLRMFPFTKAGFFPGSYEYPVLQ